MTSKSITAPAPAEVVTTVATPTSHPVAEKSLSFTDISFLLAICVALTIIVGFFLNRSAAKRKEDKEEADARKEAIMREIKKSHDDSSRDVHELSDKVRDGRTSMEKDIEAIRSQARHDKLNAATVNQATAHLIEKTHSEMSTLRDRMTVQEERSRNHDTVMSELKSLIREKNEETKQLIKDQGEKSDLQFKELCASIREVTKREAKTST